MSRKSMKILHVEDDPLYASLMGAILEEDAGLSNYSVVHVDSLKKALHELKNKGYGAVLLDLSLQDVCGLDNVRAITEENPDLPIIVLSGADNEDMAMQALDEGAQDFIIKGHANNKVVRMAIKSSIKRKAFERELFHRANYDALTGLVNRAYFVSHLQHAIIAAKRWNTNVTVLFVDLDNFKMINDTHGHEAGNAVLREVAQRMKHALRATDIVARYGGDEFVILLDDRSDDPKQAWASIVAKLQNSFNVPVLWNGKALEFSASIGIATYPESGENAETLLESADKAMYQAKKNGGRHFRVAVK